MNKTTISNFSLLVEDSDFVKLFEYWTKLKMSSEIIMPLLKDYVVLNSGHKMPLRGFGTSNLKAKPFEVKEAVYQALQTGYRYRVDCQNYQGLLNS